MDAAHSFDMSVYNYQNTRRHITDDSTLPFTLLPHYLYFNRHCPSNKSGPKLLPDVCTVWVFKSQCSGLWCHVIWQRYINVSKEISVSIFYREDGDIWFLRNICVSAPGCIASQPKKHVILIFLVRSPDSRLDCCSEPYSSHRRQHNAHRVYTVLSRTDTTHDENSV
jgi:hypothetical protein